MRYYLIFILGFTFQSLCGQVLIHEKNQSNPAIPQFTAPFQDNATLIKGKQGKAFSALTFAHPIETSLDCEKDGSWESISNDRLMWRMRIYSEGATSLNFAFDKYIMPKGGQMIIYSSDYQHIAGPFTSYDNNTNGQLWSPILLADAVTIQVVIPAESIDELQLSIGQINHGFDDSIQKSFSQSCHLDVVCGEADGFPIVESYRDVIRSVGVYSISGTRLCTGALINNEKNDCKPYFLTADHCGITQANESTVVIHWKYENSTCRQPDSPESGGLGDGNLGIMSEGVKLRASWPDSDMALVELDDDVPVEADPFFAGWDISTEAPIDGAICIHHPNVDEKRISVEEQQITTFQNDPFYWYVDNWEIGSTESGSSGAPLFNSNQEIIGQIFGGEASCGNGLWDIFGKLDVSWEGNGTKQGSLKDWLDPDNTGITRLGGRACTALLKATSTTIGICNAESSQADVILSVNDGFAGEATLSFESPNEGIIVSFQSASINPSENIITRFEVSPEVGNGTYEIILLATEGNTEARTIIELEISKERPTTITKNTPEDRGTVGTQISFGWEDDYDSYQVEVSRTEDFNILIIQETTTESSIPTMVFDAETEYFWRIRGVNACGTGDWNVFTFETGKIECFSITSGDLPKTIESATANTVFSEIAVDRRSAVVDVNIIEIMGSHSWVGDLQFRLQSPSGTEITLLNQECDNGRNFNFGFDDQSDNFIDCPLNRGTTYVPQFPLSSFVNEFSDGNWKLSVLDLADQDGGSFDSWTIEICVNVSKNSVSTEETVSDDFKVYPNPAQNQLFIEKGESKVGSQYRIHNVLGQQVLGGELSSQIDISSLENGIYLVSIFENNQQIGMRKIFVSK